MAAHPEIARLAGGVLAVITVIMFARIALPGASERHIAQVWGLAAILALMVRQFLAGLMSSAIKAPRLGSKLHAFADTLSFGIAWGLFGLAALSTMTVWSAGPGFAIFSAPS
ncbi:hypothetical protein [Aurantimonas endophytica]|uniref:Uncharacterized protein n=1 Tax=Aurantimonas endophytica TaxID=1522175 RepID=A0A7W6HI27_9HYPH|nr:hypothetical protein [Aurantimonas endophytica]MBB4005654.1 hypothetical protein [Aurantimonas endophytica]MCO6406394.1 hypothetical protein [Aurantimonas endophytica]